MKKLHVDRPDEIDDHKEFDLLQRLAISWDVPENQLKELTDEIDSWLRNRSDDSCIALRKAQSALVRHRALESSYHDNIRSIEERTQEQTRTLQFEVDRALATYEASKGIIDKLTKEVNALKMQNHALQSNTQRYTPSRNPLPRPPEPIPTDKVPTFEQAILQSGSSIRFAPLPVSPRSTAGTPYPFEIERRSHRKGKSKSDERTYSDDSPRYTTSAPAEQSHHASHSASSPASHHSYDPYSSPPQHATRESGLQMHFDNTAQPLDAFSLTHAYLREYSSGFVNGQEAAFGKRITEFPTSSPTPLAGQSSSSRHRTQPTSAAVETPYGHTTDTSVYPTQPYSAPVASERSPRPTHRRQATATSIISSSTSSGRLNTVIRYWLLSSPTAIHHGDNQLLLCPLSLAMRFLPAFSALDNL
ncbi:hypothetical protein CPB84DRAFT_155616 [Gymnopilus junonius]|uniref:Uncharacterized protein n=1 Tax=Gymnopilus junonius TaxID=109634 RepID=A0A9P5TIC3_GYMJU|nr:hypothetical protein CPB84DRAFT_155616 [Gymnopilus junonius]